MIRNPQRLLDPHVRWIAPDGRLTKDAYGYLREMDEAVRQLIAQANGLVVLDSYEVSGVPDASENAEALIYVSDETDGAVPAFSDGTDWRRVTDRNVISS
jgi:hypothetical protein